MKVVDKFHFGSFPYNITPTLHEHKINLTTFLNNGLLYKTLMHGIFDSVKFAPTFI
jgi:hypothetical protein